MRSDFKFALVARLFHADIEHVDAAAERADADLGAVGLPRARGHGVVVLDLAAADLVPLRAACVEVVDVEAVEVADDCRVPVEFERGAGELLHLLASRVVEPLESVTARLVEGDPTVVTGGEDVLASERKLGRLLEVR